MIEKKPSRGLLAAAASPPEERDAMRKAEDALQSWLADGPVEVKALKKRAEEAGIGWRTLERAKQRLRVKTAKTGGPGNKNGPWIWLLLGEDRQRSTNKQSTKNGATDASQGRPPAEDPHPPLADFSEGNKESSFVGDSEWGPWDWGESVW